MTNHDIASIQELSNSVSQSSISEEDSSVSAGISDVTTSFLSLFGPIVNMQPAPDSVFVNVGEEKITALIGDFQTRVDEDANLAKKVAESNQLDDTLSGSNRVIPSINDLFMLVLKGNETVLTSNEGAMRILTKLY